METGDHQMIFRIVKQTKEIIVISKQPILHDKRLSLKSKGLLTYLVGHPDRWELNLHDMMNLTFRRFKFMKTDIRGCSTCPVGQEQYEEFKAVNGKKYVQYEYRDFNGRLFTCVAKNIDIARDKKEKWIFSNYPS
jgi:hypothetical protein